MNRRLKQSGDSTEMLLDTVCNFFGGIVLIALLIALTSSSDSQDFEQDVQQAINDTINRKLDQSEADLAALGAFKDEFDQVALLFANIVKLQEALKLNEELESLRQEFMEQKAINDYIQTQLQFQNSQIALGKKKGDLSGNEAPDLHINFAYHMLLPGPSQCGKCPKPLCSPHFADVVNIQPNRNPRKSPKERLILHN